MFQDVVLWPREQARYATPDQVSGFINNRTVTILPGLPAYQIPDNPTWTEDPYDSRTWQLYYNSLGWLYAAEEAYKEGKFPGFVAYAKQVILSFMAANTDRSHPATDMAFNDGANAFRTATIAYIYQNYFRTGNPNGTSVTFTPSEQALFIHGLHNERDQLVENLASNNWDEKNHKFFHGMALASYATVFGNAEHTPFFESNAPNLLTEGLTSVREILESIINVDTGVTREQSFTYHRLDMGLVLEAQDSLAAHGYSLGRDYTQVLNRMVEFDVLSNRPDSNGTPQVSEIGDTFFDGSPGSFYIGLAIARGYGTPWSDYVLSHGAHGTRPPDLIDYASSGYVIIRPEYTWENQRDLRVLMDVSEHLVGHGHVDNTSFIMSAYGQRILIDSGGPYSYDTHPEMGLKDSFKNAYFATAAAHNLLQMDGKDFDADTQVLAKIDAVHYAAVLAKHTGYDQTSVWRQLIVLKDGVVLSFDHADTALSGLHSYTLNWHFDPKAQGLEAARNTDFKVGDAYVDAAFVTGRSASYQLISGRLGTAPQGWVTTGLYAATPAPVLSITQNTNDAWFASGFAVSDSAAATLRLNIARDAGTFEGFVRFGSLGWQVQADDSGQIAVNRFVLDTTTAMRLGTEGNDVLTYGADNDWIVARAGDDLISAMDGSDRIFAGGGNDTILGGSGNDFAGAGTGDDIVDGGSGADTLAGGTGNDTYSVDNAGDIVAEQAGQGIDTVKTDLAGYVLGDNLETLILVGSGNINGTGNALDNLIIGNGANNVLTGGPGNDTLSGGAGDDLLVSGTGGDRMIGGLGNDSYQLGVGDTIIEQSNAGIDTVFSALATYTLGATLENLTLIGSAVTANGNALDNAMTGNVLNNLLQGGDGRDTINGLSGNDTINGGTGADVLTGGAGNDVFLYRALADSPSSRRDLITDLSAGDMLDLRQIDADTMTAGDQAFHQVAAFTHHASELVLTYEAAAQRTLLTVDVNGDAIADLFVYLTGSHTSAAGWWL